MEGRGLRGSLRSAVKLRDGYRRQVNSFQAPEIDRSHPIAFRIGALGVRMYAAGGAKAMFDYVPVERIGAGVFFRREEAELLPRDEPQQRAFALANRAIARHRTVRRSFDFECDFSAVTASSMDHKLVPPGISSTGRRSCRAAVNFVPNMRGQRSETIGRLDPILRRSIRRLPRGCLKGHAIAHGRADSPVRIIDAPDREIGANRPIAGLNH